VTNDVINDTYTRHMRVTLMRFEFVRESGGRLELSRSLIGEREPAHGSMVTPARTSHSWVASESRHASSAYPPQYIWMRICIHV